MKKSIARLAAAALMVTLIAFCFAGCGKTGGTNAGYTAENTEFFIGGTGPLTGDASSYGISVQEGAKLAIKQINEAGGLNGIKFKFEMKDDKATAATRLPATIHSMSRECRPQSALLHPVHAIPLHQRLLRTICSL